MTGRWAYNDRLSSTSAENKVELLEEMLSLRCAVAGQLNFNISNGQNKRSQTTHPRIREGDLPTLLVGLLASGRRLLEPDLLRSGQKTYETPKFGRGYCHFESHNFGQGLGLLVERDQRAIRQQ
jgi:hypothetical protein